MATNLGSMGFTTVQIRVDTKLLVKELARARARIEALRKTASAKNALGGTSAMMAAKSYNHLGNTVRQHTRGMNQHLRSLRASMLSVHTVMLLLAGSGIFAAARGLISIADQSIELRNRMRLVTNSTHELTAATELLFRISQETLSPLESTVRLYTRLRKFTDEQTTSSGALLKVTKAVNQAFAIGGATVQEQIGATVQFTQGIGSNKLGGEELRSVLENAPRLAQAIADGFNAIPELAAKARKALGKEGKALVGDLKALNEEGLLNQSNTLRAVLSQVQVLNEEFENIEVSISKAAVLLRNEFLKVFLDITDSGMEPVANALRDVLLDLKNITGSADFKAFLVSFLEGVSAVVKQWRILVAIIGGVFAGLVFKVIKTAVVGMSGLAKQTWAAVRASQALTIEQTRQLALAKQAVRARTLAGAVPAGAVLFGRNRKKLAGAARDAKAEAIQRRAQAAGVKTSAFFSKDGSRLLTGAALGASLGAAKNQLRPLRGMEKVMMNLTRIAPRLANGFKLIGVAVRFMLGPIGFALTTFGLLAAEMLGLFNIFSSIPDVDPALEAVNKLADAVRNGEEGAVEAAKAKRKEINKNIAAIEAEKSAIRDQIEEQKKLIAAAEAGIGKTGSGTKGINSLKDLFTLNVTDIGTQNLANLKGQLATLEAQQSSLGKESAQLQVMLAALAMVLGDEVGDAVSKASDELENAKEKLKDFMQGLRDAAIEASFFDDNQKELFRTLEDGKKLLKEVTDLSEEQKKAYELEITSLVKLKQALEEKAEALKDAAEAREEELEATRDALVDLKEELRINEQLLAVAKKADREGGDVGQSVDDLREKLEFLKEIEKLQGQARIDAIAEFERNQQMEKDIDKLTNKTQMLNEVWEELGSTFASALEDAIVNFEDLQTIINSFLEDLTRVIVRTLAIQPVISNLVATLQGKQSGPEAIDNIFGGFLGDLFKTKPIEKTPGNIQITPSGSREKPGDKLDVAITGLEQKIKDNTAGLQKGLEALKAEFAERIKNSTVMEANNLSLEQMTVAVTNAKLALDQLAASAASAANPGLDFLSTAIGTSNTAGAPAGTIVGSTGGTSIISTPSGSRPLPGITMGGQIFGPGNAKSDSILARLSTGEFIVNARATKDNLSLLRAINENKFANGGLVGGPLPSSANVGGVSNNSHINIMIDGAVDPMETAAMVANVLQQRGIGTQKPSRQQRRAATRQLTVGRRQGF